MDDLKINQFLRAKYFGLWIFKNDSTKWSSIDNISIPSSKITLTYALTTQWDLPRSECVIFTVRSKGE